MSPPITTKPGEAIPPAPRHSITFYFGKELELAENFGANPPPVVATYKSTYPRMKPHRDIRKVLDAILSKYGAPGQSCSLFSSLQSARECVEYATAAGRDDGIAKKPVPRERISIRAFTAKDVMFAVFFPVEHLNVLAGFWTNAGVGVSSRFGEANSEHLDSLKEIPLDSLDGPDRTRPQFNTPVHQHVKERIVSYLNRAPLTPASQPRPSAQDVYLFPSGMSSMYKPITYFQSQGTATNVLFGMAFANTVVLMGEMGDFKLLGLGTDEELLELERFLAEQRSRGVQTQAIWTEFPANPLMATPNIDRLRELADEYDTLLIIDDTVGSSANIDVVGKADMLVTSLTKYFNGYADVIAGSAILNPASRRYAQLKTLFDEHHVPELYIGEAEAMELNSRDYLQRVALHNRNASALAEFLASCAKDPHSVVKDVFYPSLKPSGDIYRRFMRPATADFEPGFGCLLNVEFLHLDAARAFYDALNIHKGPHLGAPFTLVMPYTAAIYQQKLDWAAQFGIRSSQLRVALGLEDEETIIEEFRLAIDAANRAILG